MKNKESASKQSRALNETWAIRGIEPETRTAATMAARRAGLTIGAWCDRAIREAAREALKERVPGPTIEDTLAKLMESMARQSEAMATRLEALERRDGRDRGNLLARLYGVMTRAGRD